VILKLLGMVVAIVTLFLGLVALLLEIQYRCRFKEQIEISLSQWHLEFDQPHRTRMIGSLAVWNDPHVPEVILSEFQLQVVLLSATSIQNITYDACVFDQDSSSPRADGYWTACSVQGSQPLRVGFWVEIPDRELEYCLTVQLQVHTVLYGRAGHVSQVRNLVVPFSSRSNCCTRLLLANRD
jgi:hypothetical protein